MPLESQEEGQWSAPLAGLHTAGADAAHVADVVVTLWLEIDKALHPIIGHRGVAALYDRSLNRNAAAFPWLATGHQVALAAINPAALKAALVQQTPADAIAAGNAFFRSFHALLVSLVGPSLTGRLLPPLPSHPTGTPPAQDFSS